ncbi:hypothetical protein V5799_033774 [Amblyomma americanum]|uniref:Secreted protein n=1 Tax=Amblyomma americanum TaxID=6943 RepID=A0AAQ4DMC4_AMBAM
MSASILYSLGVLLESQCWAQSPNAASFYCLHSFRHVGGFDLDTASPVFTSHTKIWTRPRLPVLVEPHVPALCSAALEDGGINKVPASVSHQAHVLLAISRLVHEEPELEYRAAACLRRLCLKRYHHVGASDSRDPLRPCHSRDGEGERLSQTAATARDVVSGKGCGRWAISKVPASVSHQAHVLLAISSVIQDGARRARTRVSSSGLLTLPVSETLSSRGRQRQPRPASSLPQQGWGRREAVTEPGPAAPGRAGQAHRTNEASVNVRKAVFT